MERGNKPLPSPTPREELSKERRHAALTSFLQQNNLNIKDFLRLYVKATKNSDEIVGSIEENETPNTHQGINSADYAFNHFQLSSKWKKK